MQLISFRIFNFRSIVDSGWSSFSPDGITVLVGQNESGKSSVLEALDATLSNTQITSDDFRTGAPHPSVLIRARPDVTNLRQDFPQLSRLQINALKLSLLDSGAYLELEMRWGYQDVEGKKSLISFVKLTNNLMKEFEIAKNIPDLGPESRIAASELVADRDQDAPDDSDLEDGDEESIAVALWKALPSAVLFNEASGQLPSQVDINTASKPTGPGASAATSFLKIADIDLPELLKSDRRTRESILSRANASISKDFNEFWSQTIGKTGRLSLKCEIDNYGTEVPDKAGRPHLVFWINDGTTQLYPKQRSQGVRWFVSFYLQLKASEKSKEDRVFLLDEPGANLHSKAQGDVIKLINQLGKAKSSVIYSTHSPQMIEYAKLFRVLAVQRIGDLDDSPTKIIDAHRLGTASTDTLSPILNAMGVDLSQQQVIKKKNNVLLEEMSGYYYISSFWKLKAVKKEAHFIATTGVNKIEAFANMFIGWGLDFIVAVDDDKQGREALKSMTHEIYGDNLEDAAKHLVKLPNCPSIEDAFSKADFSRFVLNDSAAEYTESNADFIKSEQLSKPMLAYGFARKVSDEEIKFDMFDSATQEKITNIVKAIESRLK